MAEGGVVGVQVDVESVLVIQGVMLPAELDVRDLQRVADGLHGVGAGALGRAEYCDDPQRQLVTGCQGNGGCGQVSPRGSPTTQPRQRRSVLPKQKQNN